MQENKAGLSYMMGKEQIALDQDKLVLGEAMLLASKKRRNHN